MSDDAPSRPDVLLAEGRNLSSERAFALPKTYGRTSEVEALARALAGRKSTMLLGPPGVGKTAIIKKLLHYLREKRLGMLEHATLWEISTVGLVSGTRYTGQQEDKIAALLRHATPDRLVYIPDVWNLPQAGSYDTNPRGIYDLMRPGIEAESLVLLGEMSQGRWEKLSREYPMLERDFATITVKPTDEDETREVLMRTAADQGTMFEKAAIERVYSLAKKFLVTQSFPGKGVELLRRLGAAAREASGEARARPIDVEFVEEHFSKQTGLPMHMISPRVLVSYGEMEQFLEERVVGQTSAVNAVADVLALYKTGMQNPDRPAGVLLFVGPTGVGKTELAKATAEFLFGSRERIFRVDLSEYKDYHSFEKLIGNPKLATTGLLTDHVRQNPFTVVLLDEFEKGHENIADLFLQVFDDARLTDAYGETVGFHHALIILTSNVGSDVAVLSSGIGFSGREEVKNDKLEHNVIRSLEKHYRPEFLNRIDRILVLSPLGRDDLRRIARRELGKLYQREGLIERDLLLEVDDGVIELLLDKGIDPKYGARPLKRAIEELVVVPLARGLLSEAQRRFMLLRIARKGDGITISFEDTDASRRVANLERRTRVSDGDGLDVHLSLEDVRSGIGDVYERLASIERKVDVAAMKRELQEIVDRESSPSFWEDAFGHSSVLVRQHRLTVELRRIDDLRRETDLVRELGEVSFEEGDDAVAKDLTQTYAQLLRKLKRAERELVDFRETGQADAILVVRPAGSTGRAADWAKELCAMYVAWAKERQFDVELEEKGERHVLRVLGAYAYGYLRGESGAHRLIRPPEKRDDRRGEATLARVTVKPLPEGSMADVRREDDEAPIRTYDLWRSYGVRDRRTGYVEGDVRKVLAGRIDPFLDAYADFVAGGSPAAG